MAHLILLFKLTIALAFAREFDPNQANMLITQWIQSINDHVGLDKDKTKEKVKNFLTAVLTEKDVTENPMFIAALENQSELDLEILVQLSLLSPPLELKDVLCGAHVRINDGGKFTELLQSNRTKIPYKLRTETSSHYKIKTPDGFEGGYPQYGLARPSDGNYIGRKPILFPELLFGEASKDGKKHSWFQTERNPFDLWARPIETAKHAFNFFDHKVSGNQQVGPMCFSPHSEKNKTAIEIDETNGSEYFEYLKNTKSTEIKKKPYN